MKNHVVLQSILAAMCLQGCGQDKASPNAVNHEVSLLPDQSILEIMLDEITPATNSLWAAYDPKTDEEWTALEEAAKATIGSARKTALGGTGPMDADWVADPAYQAMNQIMLSAAEASLAAIKAKDMDALFEAGDQLYAPCEACHLQFNPAVANLPM